MHPVAPAISARYELIEPLSATTLATTYVARERATGIRRVVKVPRTVVLDTHEPLNRFREVVARVRQIDHPNILHIEEVDSAEDQVWVIYPFEESPSVRDLLNDGIPLGKALKMVSQAAEGLDAAHAVGIVHGDIRPSNLFWQSEEIALLSDFGTSILTEGVHPLMRESVMTPLPSYLAPELSRGRGPTQSSDIYALGCLLYELVTGQPPIFGTGAATVFAKQRDQGILIPSSVNPALPPEVETAILRALEYRPAERYASAVEMARALKEIISGLSPTEANLIVPPDLRRSEARSPSRMRRVQIPEARPAAPQEEQRQEGFASCPVCHKTNSASADFCSRCWYDLSGLPVMDKEEARHEESSYRRKLLLRRGARYSLPALAVLLGIFWFTSQDQPPGLGLPSPISTLSAIPGEGEWVSYAHDSQGTGSVSTTFPVPTGKVRWQAALGAPLPSSPVVAGDRVFVTTSGKRIFALERQSGKRLWEYETSGPVYASPVIAGDLLFVGLQNSTLLALRVDTGQEAWKILLGQAVLRSVAVMDGVVYAAGMSGTVYARDAATGEERWSLPLAKSIRTAPAISDGLLVIGTGDRHIYVVDAETGDIRLDYQTPRSVEASAAIDPERGVAYVGNRFKTVTALNINASNKPFEKRINYWWAQLHIWGYLQPPIQSGTVWLARVKGEVQSGAAVAHGQVYVGDEKGIVYALDARSGERRWTFSTEGQVRAPIAVVNEVVLASSLDGALYALDAQTGEELWRFETEDAITGGIAFAQGLLFLPSHDGVLYALE